jgi:putative glycosyltransferase (TIGR04372 family)
MGLRRRIRKVVRRTGRKLTPVLLLPAAAVIAAAGVRLLVPTRVDRIGHLVGEIDCAIKESLLGGGRTRRGVLLAPRNRVANRHILNYWKQYLTVVESPFWCRILQEFNRFGFLRYRDDMARYFEAINETAAFNSIYSEWSKRPPLLKLDDTDARRGEAALRELGLPAGARFICFHSRDGGYSPGDEHWHSFRNAPIESYLPAAAALRAQGLHCIRMGDPTMPRMSPTEGCIDYAHSSLKSDWLDVFLCARCEFFLGNTSGLYLISTAFGRPSALANLVPMSTALSGGANELGIPKLMWREKEARYLSFREVFEQPLAGYRYAELYRTAGIRPIENDPQDISALALEMLERTRETARYDPLDESLQQRFRSLFRPGHYGFGSKARVGRDFLRKFARLLD